MKQDQHIHCIDCDHDFIWTIDEQQHYKEQGFTHAPRRCLDCRRTRRAQSTRVEPLRPSPRDKQRGNRARVQTSVTCAKCHRQTTVPFKPQADKPVYCRGCLPQVPQKRSGQRAKLMS